MSNALTNIAYVVASSLFILGLKGLAHPRTAVRGNLMGALGMLIAIVVTLLKFEILSLGLVFAAFIVGSAVGVLLAFKIQMTAMPQLVALYNGFGGAASVLVAGAALIESHHQPGGASIRMTTAIASSGLVGSVTFFGSLIAFGKLQDIISGNQIRFPGQHIFNLLLVAACVALGVWLVLAPETSWVFWTIVALAAVLGVTTVVLIGGADMPVVIALLNSYSGLAAAATGFVLSNTVLIIAGSLVGASGLILTNIMCKAMNRSLTNVLFGVMAPAEKGPADDNVYAGKIKKTSADEVAMLLDNARRVVIVPGYGMAVAQCQHPVRDLANLLESKGITVEYGIHPVAGRMPGHMNVLLAEADVPYDRLKTMEEINPTFEETDVAIILGANDVVNPMARTDPSSPIAGMPILNVDKARTVVVIKRSLSPGFAGIPNPLFAADNTLMFFADAKKAVNEMITAVKEG
ncbi:MAG: NAD synthetase [Candidatus Eisenbacteria bacterium]|nr:NAD synthetase [Candidatus Eisenbacteria bacterium]